ncbi:MAG: class I SAM-dependent methyltransferase [Acidimicrobiia bacterium]
MEGYSKKTYGAEWAAEYDQIFAEAPSAMIELLAELGHEGRVLELAIGTGRIALPLVARGVDITGIDISDEMVAGLRAKPGGDRIPVVMGDFADVAVDGTFRLVYLVSNTLFVLLDQDEQIRCFTNVAAHLELGGRFVIEAFVPDLARFDRGQRISANSIEVDRVAIEVSVHRRDQQRIDTHLIHITEAGIKLLPVAVRYAWPSEIDLMARLAGLKLENRFGGWDRRPFSSESASHISVYCKA